MKNHFRRGSSYLHPRIGPIRNFEASEYPVRFAGEVRNFDPSRYLEHKKIRRNDPFTHLAAVSQ